MNWRVSLLLLPIVLTPRVLAQEPVANAGTQAGPVIVAPEAPESHEILFPRSYDGLSDRLSGNHNFVNFINWMSNPEQNIDPRAVTAIYPMFLNGWVTNAAPIPNADSQVYGPAISVALSERFSMGLNFGGFAVASFSHDPILRDRLLALDPQGRFRDVELGHAREGWLNIGGFFQYTLIEDVKEQFLLTAGLRWYAPCGSHEMFQGYGPAELAPYLTAGKEFGKFHVLATAGYQFPAGPGSDNVNLFYGNLHFDRQCFGWLYPLVEFNASYHETSRSFGLDTRHGFFDFGNFESQGNLVAISVGANAVIIPERLEIGAVYTTLLASQGNFEANAMLVKMTLRY
jgi:hypothetical protein